MIETLQALATVTDEEHTCKFFQLPIKQALEMAAMFEADRKQNMLPRCVDCGRIPVMVYHPASGEGRCKPCARVNWRKIWRESTDQLIEDASEDPLEAILKFGNYTSKPRNETPWMIDNAEYKQ